MFKSIKEFISYWFFRYLLVTELYMVEKWEIAMIHIVYFIILTIISLFNSRVFLSLVSSLTQPMFNSSSTATINSMMNEMRSEL